MSGIITDSPEQAQVIHAPADDDVLVVAGAGSGKTYTMTRRILGLIDGGVPPERILGLTFTRKAASELLSRVSAAVSDRLSGGDENATRRDPSGRRRAPNAFLKPEVSTYDAFFQSIVRQYGLLVGFDRDTQPLSDAGAMNLASNVIGRHLDLLMPYDFGAFSTIVDKTLLLSHAIGNAMIGGAVDTVDEAIARIRRWDADFIRQLDKAIGQEPVPQEQPKVKVPTRRKKDTDAAFAAKRDAYRDELRQLCVWRCAALRDVTRKREVLLELVEEYEREKRRQNMAEFSDFTVAAYKLVSRFPSIWERYRRRYTHVLLDEYQDTSTTQAMLLAALFHPTDPGTFPVKASGNGVAASAVNAVGDPFQSIYAWRGASPGAFRMFQHDFGMSDDAKPYPLSVTRRNTSIVLEAANNLTMPLRLPDRRPGSSLMREVEVGELSALDDAATGTIGVLGFDTFGQEIDAVARFAREAMARYATGGSSGAAGTDDHPHVAVLFRGKNRMVEFAQGLERAGLRTLVVGHSALLERPETRDLLALLRVVADHTDSDSLMRLLATPRFGLGSQELTVLADLANRLDAQYRYRALVQAGLIDDVAAKDGWAADGGAPETDRRYMDIVRAYRDQVPHAVFLADLLSRKDLETLVRRDGRMDVRSVAAVVRAGQTLRQVQAVENHPIGAVIETAVQALNLDIDMIVSQAIAHPDKPVTPSLARAGVDPIISLVDTYTQEIIEGQNPSLRGFMAWLDSLGRVEEENAVMPDVPADVVLMTIHQSKGLEWDAVAVVGMGGGMFPSNKSRLTIMPDDRHPGGISERSGRWTPPEYHATVPTWLDDEAAVPVPVRVDAGILPRFPHDAEPGAEPSDTLGMLDDVEVIDDEIYGDMRGADIGDGMGETDPDTWYLTQSEEYGRRLLADERRLAYVALTRAKNDALLTYSRYPDAGLDPRAVTQTGGRKPNATKPSVFWTEICDSLCHRDDIVMANGPQPSEHPQGTDAPEHPSAARHDGHKGETPLAVTPQEAGLPRPDGFFAGDHAASYEHAVVEEAWRTPMESGVAHDPLPWPASLSEDVMERLRSGIDLMEREPGDVGAGANAATGSDTGAPGSDARDSLLTRARMLVSDPDLMPRSYEDDTELDSRVRRQAMRMLAQGRQSVTALQARAGASNARETRTLWRGLIRPVPHVATPAAEAGTLFHAWAERFVNAYDDDCGTGGLMTDGMPSDASADGMIADAAAPASRDLMVSELVKREQAIREGKERAAKNRHLAVWQRRLVESTWAARRPVWAERQIVAALPQLGGGIVNGKLDAVFEGGLDEHDTSKRFVIVDWKTGAKPRKPDAVAEKLLQLDWYRLLLSTIERVPLDSIDATLYYLSEPDEQARELHAAAKTEEEILAELSSGIPEQSDDD